MATVPHGLLSKISSVVGGPVRRRLARYAQVLPEIEKFADDFAAQSDAELRKRSLALRYRAKSREPLARLLPEAFALVREAGRRTLNMRHFDVQMLGGIALHYRSIAEMQTGEGKTLTATLPLYLAVAGRTRGAPGHGQRLPGPARRRLDAADLRIAGLDGRRDPNADEPQPAPQGLRLRHHLRHGQGVRLRLSRATGCCCGARPKGRPISWHGCLASKPTSGGDKPVQRDAALLPGRRGRQHADRRGANAVDHQRAADAKTTRPKRSCSSGPRSPHREFEQDEHYTYDPQDAKGRADRRGSAAGAEFAAQARHRAGRHDRALRIDRAGDSRRIATSSSTGTTWSATARS